MSIVRNEAHVQQALDALLEQFKNQPNIAGLLTSFITEVQSVEDALDDLGDKQNIDLADGAYLDVLGDLVGITRGGQTDAVYRASIKRLIAIRTDGGTVREIIQYVGVRIPVDYTKMVIAVLLTYQPDATAASNSLALLKTVVVAGTITVLENPPSSGLATAWIVGGSGVNSVGNGHIGSVIT